MKTFLMYVDKSVFPDNKVVYTTNYSKIIKNISNFSDIQERLAIAESANKEYFITIFNCSDYIVSLRIDLKERDKSLMHFFEMNLNLDFLLKKTPAQKLFDKEEINAILAYQKKLKNNLNVAFSEDITFSLEALPE